MLRKFRGQEDEIVPALINCLEDPDMLVRCGAAGALGKLGGHAAPAVPALTKCLEGRIREVRCDAAEALAEAAAKQRSEALRQRSDAHLRSAAAEALAARGEHPAFFA